MEQKNKYGYVDANRLEKLVKGRGPIMRQCRDSGVNTCAFYKFLNGTSRPRTGTLVLLADYYGVSVDYLLGRSKC